LGQNSCWILLKLIKNFTFSIGYFMLLVPRSFLRCSMDCFCESRYSTDRLCCTWGFFLKMVPLGTSATEWPIVPAPGDYDDGEFGGMKIGMGNRSTRRKHAPAPLCQPQIPLDQTRARTRAAAVGSQRLTTWAMARPLCMRFVDIQYGVVLHGLSVDNHAEEAAPPRLPLRIKHS
jgi:hypothetical protein